MAFEKDSLDWEYDTDFYSETPADRVRSFEEIAAECSELMETPAADDAGSKGAALSALAEKVGKIKSMSSEGVDIYTIADTLGYEPKFVSDVLITISGSPEDDTDMAIAHILSADYPD